MYKKGVSMQLLLVLSTFCLGLMGHSMADEMISPLMGKWSGKGRMIVLKKDCQEVSLDIEMPDANSLKLNHYLAACENIHTGRENQTYRLENGKIFIEKAQVGIYDGSSLWIRVQRRTPPQEFYDLQLKLQADGSLASRWFSLTMMGDNTLEAVLKRN